MKRIRKAIALSFAVAIAQRDSYTSHPACNPRPLGWWKSIGLSVEREVGVTGGLREYVGWAIALLFAVAIDLI
ncbi:MULTISPECIES: hypothetical protein [unclassified Microcoleus]|uniref:hypothetical protein n=1 Tax=unclassified Microcoleus TaxID=2642155 RepID=UPI002FD6A69F